MSLERGIVPGNQIDTNLVELAAGTNPDVIRLNFIDVFDTTVPNSTIRTYREIINSYRERGIKILALVGAEAVGGGYDPDDPDSYTEKIARATSKVVHFFGSKLTAIEIVNNEPNDYHGGSGHLIGTDRLAMLVTRVSQEVGKRPAGRKLTIISPPIFGHDLYDNPWDDSGAHYLYDFLKAGFDNYGWTRENLPFKKIGYHPYVGQGSVDPEVVSNLMNLALDDMKWVLDQFGIDCELSISEIGWQSGVVGEDGQSANINTINDLFSADSRIGRWLYFCLEDFGDLTFGVADADGIKKSSYDVLANLPK